jgi:hypothetical protein
MAAESSRLTTCRTAVEFFKDEVERAIRAQNLQASEDVSFYLVQLLDGFIKVDEGGVALDEPLAMLLHRATFTHAHLRVAAYRQLGDVSLYLAGLFTPALRRRSVDVGYAIRMGSGAYACVADLMRGGGGVRTLARGVTLLYAEMSEKFPALVEVLMQIGESCGFGADSPDLVDLYERFARTRAPYLLERLKRRGALPGQASRGVDRGGKKD